VGSYSKGTSPFGIHDLSGNVSEWVADWFSEDFPRGDLRNPKGPDNGTEKVLRGGGWYDPAERITTTKRFHASLGHRSADVGFRCASDIK
jgi:formylglycine-generating enzyme required for sulfatase activity